MTGQETFVNPIEASGGADPVTPAEAPADDRPAHVPEKFWNAETKEVNVEALAKSYVELEKTKSADQPDAPKETPKDGLEVPKEGDPEKAVEQAGLDMEALAQEYTENGNTLKDETLAKLVETDYVKAMAEAMGVEAGDLVSDYIAGQQAIAATREGVLKAEVGGAEEYGKMVQWASQNMSEDAIKAYDAAVSSGDEASAKLAIAGLHAQYKSGNPTQEPNSQVKGGANPAQTGGFKDFNAMFEAQKDPRYGKTDYAGQSYMAEFNRRLAMSSF